MGAGLIHLGIAAGSAPVLLALFAGIGALEVLWSVVALSRPAPAPAASLAGAVLLVVAQLAVLLSGSHDHEAAEPSAAGVAVPLGTILGALLLDLALAALLALRLRRGSPTGVVAAIPFLLGTAAGAGAVALITATSLAGSSLGGQHLH